MFSDMLEMSPVLLDSLISMKGLIRDKIWALTLKIIVCSQISIKLFHPCSFPNLVYVNMCL